MWVSQSTARHSVERKVTEEEQLHTSQCSWAVSLEEAAGSSVPPGLQAVFSWIARALQQSPAWCGAAAPLAPTSKYVGQSTEKSTGLLVGIDEIPPSVLISPVPMMAPEWLWTLSIYLFLWKGTGNIPYSLESHKCNSFLFIVLNKHQKKSGKKGCPYSFTAAHQEALLFGRGDKATMWNITGSQFFSSKKKTHKSNTTSLWGRAM